MSIFVFIPSYRDSGTKISSKFILQGTQNPITSLSESTKCQHTIRDLLGKAAHPDKVTVGVCFQYDLENDVEKCFSSWPTELFPDQIRVDRVDYRQATGPCWARYRAQQLWKGEEFVLSIDSHTRFIKNWDTKLIQILSKCESPKPILTTYPLGYELPNEISKEGRPTLTCADRIAEDGMLRLKGRLLARPFFKPLPQMFWVSGFSFSRSDIIKECPYDPHLPHLFFGEESSMTLRLWTHGWDFFAPGQNIIYHLWSREHRPTFREIRDLKKEEIASQQRVKLLLGMISESDITEEHRDLVFHELDKYGLGTQRSREQFETQSGVSFSTGSVNESAMWGGHPKNIFADNLADLLSAAASSTTS